jgi:putative ABC transport system permease protein
MPWLSAAVDAVARDIRYAARLFVRQRGFALLAVVTLALGTGVNTAIFTVLYNTVLRSLPYPDAERLVRLERTVTTDQRGPREVGFDAAFLRAARNSSAFETLASYARQTFTVSGGGDADRVVGEIVSSTYFAMLGIAPVAGRSFSGEDDAPGRPVALISEALWRSRFSGQSDILGATLNLNRVPLTIVGIVPSSFRGESGTANVWIPSAMEEDVLHGQEVLSTAIIGRLRRGVTAAQSSGEVQRLVSALPDASRLSMTGRVVPLDESRYDPRLRSTLLVLFAAVSFVLLIACVNLSNLLLARGLGRRREIAVRLSLGARRATVVRQMLVECLVLSVAGTAVGLLLATWGLDALSALRPQDDTAVWPTHLQQFQAGAFRVSPGVGVFACALAVLSTVIAGIVPALQASRTDTQPTLKVDTESWSADRKAGRTWRVLIASQVALVLVLLTAAGMTLRSFDRLLARPIGVEPRNVLTFRVALPADVYGRDAANDFYDRLLARVGGLPGVVSVGRVRHLPIRERGTVTSVRIDADPERRYVGFNTADAAFEPLFGVRLLSGRTFDQRDVDNGPPVALVSASVRRQLFPSADPLGHRITVMGTTAEIVGVVADVHYEPQKPQMPIAGDVYLSSRTSGTIALRTDREPRGYVSAVRRIVAEIDPAVPVADVKTLEDYLSGVQSYARFTTMLLVAFAALALVLAMVGVYGTLSYAVGSRRREIGIRMTLGATRGEVIAMMLRGGLTVCGVGLLIGVPLSLIAARAMRAVLYETSPSDPIVIAAAILLLALAATAACFIPARRAAAVDPAVALRR